MKLNIVCIPGDGIGPEIVTEAKKVLKKIEAVYGHEMQFEDILMGGASIDVHGVPLTDEAIATAKAADAVLMGSIGGNTQTSPWYKLEPSKRPEAGLLKIRKALNLFANLRPAVLYEELAAACPLKQEISEKGFDMMIMRELTGGLYFGERKTVEENGELKAIDTLTYSEGEIRRIAIKGFEIAMKRRKNVISVDKANVLGSSRLWRKTVTEIGKEYPKVELSHEYIDSAALKLIRRPWEYDMILTANLFGDIISDEGTGLTGTAGLFGSAELSVSGKGLYTPNQLHYPDESVIGKQKVSPVGMIMAAALMLRCSFGLEKEAKTVENAIEKVLEAKISTEDMKYPGAKIVLTGEMADFCCQFLGKDV